MTQVEFDSEKDIARKLREEGMRCNCDLDNWEPDTDTGHSWVCRIHKSVKEVLHSGQYKTKTRI